MKDNKKTSASTDSPSNNRTKAIPHGSLTLTQSSSEKECVLTNNSGEDVVVLIPTAEQTTNTLDSISVYNQNLSLLTIKEGGSVIKNGASGTLTLNQQYKDSSGNSHYSLLYDLLVSKSTNFFPVANIGVMASITTPHTFKPQTATSDATASIKQASIFQQTISAYPKSKLTQDFRTAMSGAQTAADGQADGSSGSSGKVANAISSKVDAFFKGTKQYKKVTLSNLVAVQTYYNRFPFVWAGFGTKTYYLYSTDTAKNQVVFVGTLGLVPPTTYDLTKPNAGYSCTFSPAKDPTDTTTTKVNSANTKTLTYLDSLFVDNINSDTPEIAVKGLFMLKSTFTRKSSDNSILPVLTGTISGQTCLGFDEAQTSGPGGKGFFSGLFDFSSLKGILSAIMLVGGLIMMADWVVGKIKGAREKAAARDAQGEPTTKDLLDKQRAEIESSIKDQFDTLNEKLDSRIADAPADPEAAAEAMDGAVGEVGDYLDAANVNEGLAAQADVLEDLASYEGSMSAAEVSSLSDAATKVSDISDSVAGASPEKIGDVVEQAQKDLAGVTKDIGDLVTDMDSSLSDASKISITDSQTAAAEAAEKVEEAEKAEADSSINDDPIADDPVIE